ncbi:carboxypeptidase M32 [Sutcliffiella rhizosphaerae]|uniref:Metal-dependent carboxypeptidase n=1 Tax=Sutcliffiella rhizosphaerae TaxID=2880967 RepID=A0ABN8AHI5_9BACI|nr:carboxypeptidase M32 [Sutcliffiella rhizosphaerae]CAG9622593.1 Carboxypeptidase 1 [Sutcliffiella rhizosphaerae]
MVETSNLKEDYLAYVNKMESYNEALSLIFWDLRTGAPKKGLDRRSDVIGVLSSEVFKMSTSEEMASFLTQLLNKDNLHNLDDVTKASLLESQKNYERNKKIPAKEYQEYVVLSTKAESVWEEAKDKSDFTMLQPLLEQLVDFNKKFIGYWGHEGNKYNTLLDMYEPGVTVEKLDEVFGKLKERIVPLVKKIADSSIQPRTKDLLIQFPKENQRDFSLNILKELDYDFDSGRLDETVHPFSIGLNPGDVRVTTKYDEDDFRTAVFGTIHECGHALYEQNISKDLQGTGLCSGTSMGIHESQSLFYENFVGRHENFWSRHYNTLQGYANGEFDGISLEEFYVAINEAKPSFIRIEADELTYSLHIMIRYELEKELFNDELEVKDLPRAWNEKYESYLGITPSNDAEGVLQDVHWSGGSFGYFPSYALGYMYAAQFKHAMLKDLPNYDELLLEGNLVPVKEWLTTNIHQYGKLKKPLKILKDVTGEELNVQYLIEYLEDKYSNIYQLEK